MAFLGEEIKKLGFGLMRLPTVEGAKEETIDIEHTKKMVDMFLDAGYTYFDTAWAYDGSERAIKEALVKRYPREKYQLATKLAAWIKCETRADAIAQFEKSLADTGAGYFDFYLMHNLGGSRTEVFDRWGLWDWALEQKERGLIKHLGFSAHTSADEVEEIIKKHPEAEFVQLQINYADQESTSIQSRKCYEVCRRHNKPVIIMEPVKGGFLATPPESVAKILRDADPTLSPAAWAMRYAVDHEGIITVLSGMSCVDQMADNIKALDGFSHLSDAERKAIEAARVELCSLPAIPCTTCNYCAKVCPVDVGISGLFNAMNSLTLYGNEALARRSAMIACMVYGKKKASECVKCGACEEACPQGIKIREELEKIAAALE